MRVEGLNKGIGWEEVGHGRRGNSKQQEASVEVAGESEGNVCDGKQGNF